MTAFTAVEILGDNLQREMQDINDLTEFSVGIPEPVARFSHFFRAAGAAFSLFTIGLLHLRAEWYGDEGHAAAPPDGVMMAGDQVLRVAGRVTSQSGGSTCMSAGIVTIFT
ncbi:MAG TPA: hypothetical protein O0X59_01860, partial [Methanocorpusculum sp.]|nr:hypothetical protein [Methanocorpusculum sp.]